MRIVLLTALISCLMACNSKPKGPDVSNIKVDVTLNRFDQEFFDPKLPVDAKMAAMLDKYGKIFDWYLTRTHIADALATGLKPDLVVNKFLTDNKPLYDSVQKLYGNANDLKAEYTKAFQYYKHYFPKSNVPKIFLFVDAFYQDDQKSISGIEYITDTLIVDLQMFMGKNFSYYDPAIYYDYLRERFNKDYIVRNSLEQIVMTKYEPIPSDAPLVEKMIDQGKKLYVLSLLLPQTKTNIILNYTPAQYQYCTKEEKAIWTFFLNNDYLFSTETPNNRDFNGEGPYVKEIGPECPGNIGAFIGLQIVSKYMNNNSSITLENLLATDAKKIYEMAKYKP